MDELIPLGTQTEFGEVVAIHTKDGERSYFMRDESGSLTMIPGDLLKQFIQESE